MIPFVVDLEDERAIELELVGGKGVNLAILYQQKFCVPNAFIITTHVYESILNNSEIKNALSTIDNLNIDNIAELENISNHIKTIICNITLPNDIIDLIFKYHDKLSQGANNTNLHVAVRSSATAEDLPENSFAGQQDTYLHVTKENLIKKIQECWASLFTARAISYRKKSNINYKIIQLAVIIQEMISSEVSGVAFTANPITGFHNEVIIDSTYGLGEALVSGLITPDHYEILTENNEIRRKIIGEKSLRIIGKTNGALVSGLITPDHYEILTENNEIRRKIIGEKSLRIIGKTNGGIETLITNDNDRKLEALSDKYIIQLSKLVKEIEKSYNYQPQDIEWCFMKENFYILQVRPITTLFPIPSYAINQSGLRCMISFGTIQGFLEPITPLGESTIRTLLGHFSRKVGINRNTTTQDDISSNPLQHNIFKSSRNRLWIDITGILTSPIRSIFSLSMIDTGMDKIINHIKYSKSFPIKSMFKTYIYLMLFIIPLIFKSIRNFIFPRYGKNLYIDQMNKYHEFIDRGFKDESNQDFTNCVQHFQTILSVLPLRLMHYGASCVVPAIISLKILQKLSKNPMDALALTRAVESNPTTEMNLILWKITILIRENDHILKLFQNESTANLVKMYKEKLFEKNIQFEIEEFFHIYGCRGIGEIDIGRKRWCDEPQIILEQIKNYLKILNPIDKIHEQSKQSAYEALTRIENQLKWSFIQRPLVNLLFNRLKILFSLRESPKFHGIIQTFGKCRKELLSKTQLAVEENFILHSDDICFLYIDELQLLAYDTDHKQYTKRNYWKSLIEQRQIEYKKQMSCKRIPLILMSDGTTYYDASTIPDDNKDRVELMEGEFLGEALVSGLITPDHYEILTENNEIRRKIIGEKSLRIIGKTNGGIETLITKDNDRKLEALSDKYIIQLSKLVKEIEKIYNHQPQDIEWCFMKENFYILQVRPITTLFPIPNYASNQSGLRCMISFGTIQGFLEPITPLGESTIRTLLGHFSRKVGINRNTTTEDDISSNPLQHNIFKSSRNRLWIDITGILTSPIRSIFSLSMIDTGMDKIINHIKYSKSFPIKSMFKTYMYLMLFVIPLIFKSIRNFIFPRYGKNLYMNQMNKYHEFIDRGFKDESNRSFTNCVQHFQTILSVLPLRLMHYGASCVVPAVISLKLLQKLSKNPMDALALTRAVESNPTTEMNLILWKITILIRENDHILKLFQNESTINLVKMYKEKLFEKNIQFEIEEFFHIYGCRGIGEIDIGRKRWSDEPQIILEQIKNYLKILNPIDKIHEQSKQSAYEALTRIENHLKWSFIQRPLVNLLFNRLKILFSLRESPKFHGIIQTFGKCRKELLSKAQLAVDENFILHSDDICFLYIDELQLLAYDTDHKQYTKRNYWKNLIEQRQIEYKKQMSCKRIPLILMSDGTTYYDASTIPDDNK
ncbi:unnamed protein product, partial [Adineta steineri]